jgi:hypothetical protein
MPRAYPTDEQCDRIRVRHAQGVGRNAIMRELGITNTRAMDNFCKDAGLTWDRTATAAAVAAYVEDSKLIKARTAFKIRIATERTAERLLEPQQYIERIGNNFQIMELPEPSLRAINDGMSAIASGVSAAEQLEQSLGEATVESTRSMLDKLQEQITVVVDEGNETLHDEGDEPEA